MTGRDGWMCKAGPLADLIYPRRCAACGSRDPEGGLHYCWECRAALSAIQPPYCSLCGDPVSGVIDHGYRCAYCTRETIYFDTARSIGRYEGPLAELIRQLKYGGASWLAADLAGLLAAGAASLWPGAAWDLVLAVPLHPVRERQRGYNQARLLAAILARRFGLPCPRSLLCRVRGTPTQTRLSARQRAANVRGAFRAPMPRRVEGRRVLLVDDVMTTGATVNECARTLKKAGAGPVTVLTVARG